MAMSTWRKFKDWSCADIIQWILENDIISDEIHSVLKEKVNKKCASDKPVIK